MIRKASFMKTLLLCFFALLSSETFCQTIDLTEDSIKTILCKQWEVDYALVGDTKTNRLPGATEINYEFFQNGNFVMTSDVPTEKTKGTWRYEPKKKSIAMTINRRSIGEIAILKQHEFTMKMNTDKGFPEGTTISLIFKPKSGTSASFVEKTKAPNVVRIKNLSLSDTNSTTIYVGKENMLEVEGVQGNLSFSVIGAGATMKRAASKKVILLPTKAGTAIFTVTQNGKVIATKKFDAVVAK